VSSSRGAGSPPLADDRELEPTVGGVDLAGRLHERARQQGLRLGASQLAALEALAAAAQSPGGGVYLHGPAGRGKTWLLDALAACADRPTSRLHWSQLFTELDAEVGRRLYDPDRLPRAVDAVVGDVRLLCLDELQLHDPDDAGLVEHLLRRTAERGVPVVLTSNQAPSELLPDPRWHHWASGLLALLAQRYRVRLVDDGTDYRTVGSRTRFATGRLLDRAQAPRRVSSAGLVSGGRRLPVVRSGDQLWARFRDLLSSPTGKQDYLLLCRDSPTLGLLAVPDLREVDPDTRQRFALLVDVAHDSDVRLLLVTDGPADWSLLPPRTVSRLAMLGRGESLGPAVRAHPQ
jgi:cell division protein ZapE